MTSEEVEGMFKGHLDALKAWLEERYDYEARKEIMDEFIETHQLPKDITIGELFEFCRKTAE